MSARATAAALTGILAAAMMEPRPARIHEPAKKRPNPKRDAQKAQKKARKAQRSQR